VLDNFSLGVMGRWGFDYEHLRRLRPDIIAISLKGLGSTGPHAHYVTWGPNLTALFGMTHLWNHPDAPQPTAEARAQHPDFMSGVCGAFAVMAALIHRQRTGEGQFIDGAQVEAGAALLGPFYMEDTLNGVPPQPQGNRHPTAAPYGAYRCRDGDRWCTMVVYTDGDWARFRRALGDPSWAAEARFQTVLGRLRHRSELDALVESWTAQHDAYEVMRLLQAAGVEAGVVQDVEDHFARDEQYRARGFLVELQEPELGPLVTEGVPIHLSATPGGVRTHAPLLGEHTERICRDVLGLSDEEVAFLTEQKVLY
ncbi:MAG: CoA transferase, partial [Chloroflexi bacterium]|nr:CoA transferase [Chloroflexota bacterium]